jgi:putative oxidoreductase
MTMPNNAVAQAALMLRLSLGAVLLAQGLWLKVSVFGLGGAMGYVGATGYPPILGAVVAIIETLAGLALVLGVLVRPAALAMLPVMLGASLQYAGNGWLFRASGGGWEFPVFLTATLVVHALLGAGPFAWRPAALPRPMPARA